MRLKKKKGKGTAKEFKGCGENIPQTKEWGSYYKIRKAVKDLQQGGSSRTM